MSGANIGGLAVSAACPRVAASFWRPEADLPALAARGLDIAEIRLDKAAVESDEAVRALCESFSAMPSLLTIRIVAEGGEWSGADAARRRLFLTAMPHCDAVDIELASPLLPDIAAAAREQQKTLILSRHNFAAADDGETLDAARAAAEAAGADIFKTAGLCADEGAWRTLAAFARRCRAEPLPCAVIGMDDGGGGGDWARRARRELPSLGSCLAFAAIGDGSAPGQLSLDETAAAVRAAADATGA